MRLNSALLLCMLFTSRAQSYTENLPTQVRVILNRNFSGWKLSDVNPQVSQFFIENMRGTSPVVISGDFDGNRRVDYAALVQWRSRDYLVIFLRRSADYKMYVIKDPGGDYLCLAKKGTRGYNYEEQKEITYANDAIFTGFFEKGGSSYVLKNGRFRSFVSSD